MLYLGIDLHRKQLTVSLRDEAGDVILKRQVSTRWEPVRAFLEDVGRRGEAAGGFVAIVEVCGFQDWLLVELERSGCRLAVVVQPESRRRRKTDRRDADQLGEILWVNRARFLAGKSIQGVRRIVPPSPAAAADRQLVSLRKRAAWNRTRTLNQIQRLLLKHNLHQECPTKGLQTRRARAWLAILPLGGVDRLALDQLLAQWTLWDRQLETLDAAIKQRAAQHPQVAILRTIPRLGDYTALAIAASVGDIGRFPHADSLANYWGLTPSCRNSGETERPGSITKDGSPTVRFLLGQMVLQTLKHDRSARDWFRRIKRRRGGKIAFVAVMRKLATILWQLLKHQRPYEPGCWLSGPQQPGADPSAQAQTKGSPPSPSPSSRSGGGETEATARTKGARGTRCSRKTA